MSKFLRNFLETYPHFTSQKHGAPSPTIFSMKSNSRKFPKGIHINGKDYKLNLSFVFDFSITAIIKIHVSRT